MTRSSFPTSLGTVAALAALGLVSACGPRAAAAPENDRGAVDGGAGGSAGGTPAVDGGAPGDAGGGTPAGNTPGGGSSAGNPGGAAPGSGAGGSGSGASAAGGDGTAGADGGVGGTSAGGGTQGQGGPAQGGGGAGGDGAGPGGSSQGGGGASDGTGGTSGGGEDACAGLLPTFGDAVTKRLNTGTHTFCAFGTSAPSGAVALGIFGAFGSSAGTDVRVFHADGSPPIDDPVFGVLLGLFPSDVLSPRGIDIDPWFHPSASGFQGLVHDLGVVPTVMLRTWAADGSVLGTVREHAASSAPDGQGGTVLLAYAFDAAAPSTFGPPQLLWVDASGAVTRTATIDGAPRLVMVSWGTGHVLVATEGTPAQARWFDASGTPLTAWFDVPQGVQRGETHLLVDGTVVLGDASGWSVAFPDGAGAPAPIPAWLAQRRASRLATIRGGRGYAVLPPPRVPVQLDGAAADRFEVVTAAGQSCGTVTLPVTPAAPGETETPMRLDVGQDGTLLQLVNRRVPPTVGGINCGYHWWPGLLR